MSLRNLMTQKKAALRIDHPMARYDVKNQLHCKLCTQMIKHESLWSSHLNSKSHRANVLRLRQEEEEASRKRALEEEEEAEANKRARVDDGATTEDADTNHVAVPAVAETLEEEDEEWLAFERDILAEPVVPVARGTISAQEKIFDPDAQDDGLVPPEPVVAEDDTPKETEEERKEREEKEELMARIEEEEREQMEADQRVVSLKARLEAIRKARAASKK